MNTVKSTWGCFGEHRQVDPLTMQVTTLEKEMTIIENAEKTISRLRGEQDRLSRKMARSDKKRKTYSPFVSLRQAIISIMITTYTDFLTPLKESLDLWAEYIAAAGGVTEARTAIVGKIATIKSKITPLEARLKEVNSNLAQLKSLEERLKKQGSALSEEDSKIKVKLDAESSKLSAKIASLTKQWEELERKMEYAYPFQDGWMVNNNLWADIENWFKKGVHMRSLLQTTYSHTAWRKRPQWERMWPKPQFDLHIQPSNHWVWSRRSKTHGWATTGARRPKGSWQKFRDYTSDNALLKLSSGHRTESLPPTPAELKAIKEIRKQRLLARREAYKKAFEIDSELHLKKVKKEGGCHIRTRHSLNGRKADCLFCDHAIRNGNKSKALKTPLHWDKNEQRVIPPIHRKPAKIRKTNFNEEDVEGYTPMSRRELNEAKREWEQGKKSSITMDSIQSRMQDNISRGMALLTKLAEEEPEDNPTPQKNRAKLVTHRGSR